MSWPLVKISQLVSKVGKWNPVKEASDKEFFYIDLSSVDKDKKAIVKSKVPLLLGIEAPSRARQLVRTKDVLVATVRPNLNGVALVGKSFNDATASTGYCVLRADPDKLDYKYLFYWVQTVSFISDMVSKATGANYPAVSDKIIRDSEIPLPPLDEQRRIAAILDKADAIRHKRKQALALADDFLRSVFFDMFGDPATNPKGWEVKSLVEYGEFKNGLNFANNESGEEIYCLGVGDFKSREIIDNVESLPKLQLSKLPEDGYNLRDNDLVFVRSNGNKALVGRCLTVHPGTELVTYSGFCIRYRIVDTKNLNADYVNYCMRMPAMKRAMLSGGQGANIQNISQKTLSSLGVPIPPIEFQNEFSNVVGQFRVSSYKTQRVLQEAGGLFLSISSKAFSGQF